MTNISTLPAEFFAIILHNEQIVLQDNHAINLVSSALHLDNADHYMIGMYSNKPLIAVNYYDATSNDIMGEWVPLRQALDIMLTTETPFVFRALHFLKWLQTTKFCSQCGTKTILKLNENAKECPQCGHLQYPRFSPAIMVLISRGKELLLARSPHFRPGMYSALAGFVNPGESALETIHREVYEEVGVEVNNIAFFGSQTWPFPDSFMLAFFADYAGGELKIDPTEIEDAQWFNLKKLPEIPSEVSIAGQLIRHFMANNNLL